MLSGLLALGGPGWKHGGIYGKWRLREKLVLQGFLCCFSPCRIIGQKSVREENYLILKTLIHLF